MNAWFKMFYFAFLTSAMVAAVYVWCLGYVEVRIETQPILGNWFKHLGVDGISKDIVIVKIDDKTYKTFRERPQPFPRKYIVELFRRFQEVGVRGVAFDCRMQEIENDLEVSVQLAEEIKKVPTLLGLFEQYTGANPKAYSHKIFRQSALAEGALDITKDEDGIVRRFPVTNTLPLGLVASRFFQKEDSVAPWDRSAIVDFYGGEKMFSAFSLSDVLRSKDIAQYLKNKVVFIGYEKETSSPNLLMDRYTTSVGDMYGVEIHATILNNAISNNWIRRLPVEEERISLFFVLFLFSLVVLLCRPLMGAIFIGSVWVGWLALSYRWFLEGFYFPGVLTGTLAALSVWVIKLAFCYLISEKKWRSIVGGVKERLMKYLGKDAASKQFAELLVDQPVLLESPENAHITQDAMKKALLRGEAVTPAEDKIAPGSTISGRYLVGAELGGGAFGAVYAVAESGKRYALKVLRREFGNGKEWDLNACANLFIQEMRALITLDHPNVVKIIDHGRDGKIFYYVMEFLDGITLQQKIEAGPLDVNEVVGYIIQICNGLEAIHERNFIHCDLKPANVMVVKDGGVKICDLGIAFAYDSTKPERWQTIGTATIIAPELWTGQEPTPQSDIYALGMIIYELLAGTLPFSANTLQELMQHHRQTIPKDLYQVNPKVPKWLSDIVQKTLEKNPEQRFESPGALRQAILEGMKLNRRT